VSIQKSLIAFFLLLINYSYSQDIGVVSILAPTSGCALSPVSDVTVVVFNFGSNINTNFDVSYQINGGPIVTETVVITPPFLSSSTYTYTFATKANLSVSGTYDFDAFTSYPGDVNASNDSTLNYMVTSSATTVGGSVSGTTNVCTGTNTGTFNLTGNIGSVLNWEFSTDGGTTWNNIANTTTSLTFNNISDTTMYRANVKSGTCPSAFSTPDTVVTNPPTVAGSLTGGATGCSGMSGTIYLTGQTGTVSHWEYSTDGGGSWNIIASTADSLNYSGLTITTFYRAFVQSGACSGSYSSIATINVLTASVGGSVSGSGTVCSGVNSGSLILSGYIGNVLRWESSTDGGTTWTPIANTSISQAYVNLAVSTMFRAVVENCPPSANSTVATINIDSPSLGGTISGGGSFCPGASGVLTLAGYNGSIVEWESSINGGASWTTISNTGTTQSFTSITQTTIYRAEVINGSCPPANSAPDTVIIFPQLTNAGNDTSIVIGQSIVLNGTGNGSATWSPVTGLNNASVFNPIASPDVTTTYTLTVVDTNGCIGSDMVELIVLPLPENEFKGIISNLFTPNADGFNDAWYIQDIQLYPGNQVFVYNLNGNLIFSAVDYANDWQGTYKGADLPDGTYFYIIRFDEGSQVVKGSVDILRNSK
jgi:gliding motility-associated-like protein